MSIAFSIHSVEDLADRYARSRKSGIGPISTKAAIRAVRTILPDSPISDKEMASIIAAKAVAHGHAVDFDAT